MGTIHEADFRVCILERLILRVHVPSWLLSVNPLHIISYVPAYIENTTTCRIAYDNVYVLCDVCFRITRQHLFGLGDGGCLERQCGLNCHVKAFEAFAPLSWLCKNSATLCCQPCNPTDWLHSLSCVSDSIHMLLPWTWIQIVARPWNESIITLKYLWGIREKNRRLPVAGRENVAHLSSNAAKATGSRKMSPPTKDSTYFWVTFAISRDNIWYLWRSVITAWCSLRSWCSPAATYLAQLR